VPLERYYSQDVLDEAVKRACTDALKSVADLITQERDTWYRKRTESWLEFDAGYTTGLEQALKIVKEAMNELQG